MLGTGTRGSKHSQHVPHCLSRLRLNAVEQFSGVIGAELAIDSRVEAYRKNRCMM